MMANKTAIRSRDLIAVVLLAFGSGTTAWAVVVNMDVTGETGNPIPGATIRLVTEDGVVEEEETDDKGLVVFNVPGGSYKVLVKDDDHLQKELDAVIIDYRRR